MEKQEEEFELHWAWGIILGLLLIESPYIPMLLRSIF
jgi:hypothetical protein